jgi:PhnB protein
MAKQSPSEQLDRVISRLLGRPDVPLPRDEAVRPLDPSFSPVIEVIAALRDLPRPDFKARLKSDLERRASMASASEPAVNFIRPGFHTVTPYLIISGAAQWIDFVKQAFGAEEKLRAQRPGTNTLIHAEVKIGDSMIELADANPQFPAMPMTLLIRVDDPDAVYNRAVAAGAIQFQPMRNAEYGVRGGALRDSSGNNWFVFTPLPGDKIFTQFRSVTSHLHPEKSEPLIAFLQKAFGGEEVYRAQSPDGVVHHAQVRIGDSLIGMGDAHGDFPAIPSTLHLYVPNTNEVYESALRAGAESIQPPTDQPYGDRSAGVRDPFGNRWFIATHLRDVAP